MLAAPAVILTPGLLMPVRAFGSIAPYTRWRGLWVRSDVPAWFEETERRVHEQILRDWGAAATAVLTTPARPWFRLVIDEEKRLLLGA